MAGKSLGTFGTKKEQQVVEETTFEWFGVEICLSPKRFNELEFIDLMESMSSVEETDPRAATMIKSMFRGVLAKERAPEETRALWSHLGDLRARLDKAEHDEDVERLLDEVAQTEKAIADGDPYKGRGFETFWSLARANDQEVADLMPVYRVLVEAQTNRPTQRPTDSSAGPQATPPTSPVDSSSAPESSGRPDLQVMKENAEAQRARLLAVG